MQQSIARYHYPHFVFRDGEKMLWNPVLKKTFANRPEERVRLRLIDYFLLEAGFPAAKMAFEAPVKLPGDKTASRTDILLYDKDFMPLLLAECKAASVPLSAETALQIARYNRAVKAPFLLVSNGSSDFWFAEGRDTPLKTEQLPTEFRSNNNPGRDLSYWQERGFAGTKTHPETRKWLLKNCTLLYHSAANAGGLRYLRFEDSDPDLALPNFYYVHDAGSGLKLAVALGADPYGATRLSAIFNIKGQNEALLSCSLDLLAAREPENTLLITAKDTFYIDLAQETGFNFETSVSEMLPKLIPLYLR